MKKGFVILGILLISGLFVFVEGVSAVPSIGSAPVTISDGETLVITGTGFGVKAAAAPLVFDNFDSNDAGRQNTDEIKGKSASHFGTWANYSVKTIPTYTNSNQRAGSTLSSYNYLTDTSTTNSAAIFIDFAGSHQSTILIDFWFSFTPNANLDGDESGQWQHKIWRFGDGGEVDGQAHFQHLWIHRNINTAYEDYKRFLEIFHNDVTNPIWPSAGSITKDLSNFKQDGTWHHIIVRLKDTGKADIYVNDVRETTDADLDMTTWIAGDEWKRATFAWYLGTETFTNPTGLKPTVTSYYDDIYIDNSWQSVYICESPDWDSCTHREIQPPTLWLDGSITIEVNQGSFVDGEDVYLFVVDENGDVSNGYLVTLGDGLSNCGDADTSKNNIIEIGELINYISQWKAGNVVIGDLITAIGEWKNGC